MFRRLPHSLPRDLVLPADLEQLGYFINEDDQIRKISNPELKHQFCIDRNDRVNHIYNETLNKCVRTTVQQRLSELDFETMRLPLGATATDNHVPIFLSPNISSKKRVKVIFGERNQDPGIFSYRVASEEGVHVGSVIDFAKASLKVSSMTSEDGVSGIVIANPGQLLWYRGGQRAVTRKEWLTLPREFAVYEPFRVDQVRNAISGNRDFREHVNYVFEVVLKDFLHKDAKLELIGLEYTGAAALEYLAQNWSAWSGRITGICLGGPQHKIQDLVSVSEAPDAFLEFLSKRCRAYLLSPSRLETKLAGRSEFGCNCYASGEEMYQPSVIVRSWRSMLDWFNLLCALPGYEEVQIVPVDDPEALAKLA